MRYLSVCSGIEAATAAWHPLGWEPAAFSEIEAFPRAVLQHHYPDVPLHGDFTTIGADDYGPVDLLVGGTPCQSFSIAGLRGGLDDERGNLALEFLKLAQRTCPRWLVWENVPGVLSSNGGRDFGSILGGLVELGYGFAYRVLDAQYFGLAQRRRRVFVVGYLGDWRRAAAVLFERHSLSGHPAPRREKGKDVAGTLESRSSGGGGGPGAGTDGAAAGYLQPVTWPAEITPTLTCDFGEKHGQNNQHIFGGQDYLSLAKCLTTGTGLRYDAETETLIPTHGGGFDVATAYRTTGNSGCYETGDKVDTLTTATDPNSHIVAFDTTQITSPQNGSNPQPGNPCHPLAAGAHAPAIALNAETMYGVSHADAQKTGPNQALRELRQAVGAEAFTEWGLGVLAAFRTPEILRSKVHGKSIRWAHPRWIELDDNALSCEEDCPEGDVFALWQAGCVGRSPRGWQPSEQLAGELVAHLSELPHQRASAQRFLLGMWRAAEGIGLLRQALSALQEVWRPTDDKGEPAHSAWAVRRLTPKEAERLQGFPDNFTRIPWRGKPAEDCPDGPRYKALGNSMAVPVMAWIGKRIQIIEEIA